MPKYVYALIACAAVVLIAVAAAVFILSPWGSDNSADSPATSPYVSDPQGSSPGDSPAPSIEPPPIPPPSEEIRYVDQISIIIDYISELNHFGYSGGATAANWIYTMTHDRLLVNLGDGSYDFALATSMSTHDYRTFRFTLRDDVYFHNGENLTAHDVAFTIEMALQHPGTPAGVQWEPVQSVRVIDEYSVELTLNSVNVDFPYNLSMPGAGIINERAVREHDGFSIGTGAYVLVDYEEGWRITLERNDNYWGEAPITTHLFIQTVPESATRSIMVFTGEAQVGFGVVEEDLNMLAADYDYQVFPVVSNSPTGIFFNMEDPITGDRNFRMAVMHALDRNAIAHFAAGEWAIGDHSAGTAWGFGTEFRNNSIPEVPYDADLAREYLTVSGYGGEEVEIVTLAIGQYTNAVEVIREQLSAIGINVYINILDVASFLEYIDYSAYGSQMVFYVLPMNLSSSSFRNSFYPNARRNFMSYDNPEVTWLLDDAAAMTDVNMRREYFLMIQQIVSDDAPFINVYWRINAVAAARGIGGMRLSHDPLLHDLRYIYWIDD